MTEHDLITLFNKYGYTCVYTLGRYHAIKPEEIEDKKVKDPAYSMIIVSDAILNETPAWPIDNLIARIQTNNLPGLPFDITQQYQILPKEEVKVPEWKGWDIGELRKKLGIDK